MFNEKGVLKNFAKSTGKHLYRSLAFIKLQAPTKTLLKKGFRHRSFLVNIVKLKKKLFSAEHLCTTKEVFFYLNFLGTTASGMFWKSSEHIGRMIPRDVFCVYQNQKYFATPRDVYFLRNGTNSKSVTWISFSWLCRCFAEMLWELAEYFQEKDAEEGNFLNPVSLQKIIFRNSMKFLK